MKILFQGDSITDFSRDRNDDSKLGTGYAHLVKCELGYEYPGEYEFINRGVSGNRIVDIYARIGSDIINLKPDFMSILVGINDAWHDLLDSPNGVDGEKYYKIYDMLISEIKEKLPHIKIMIMEPFVLRCENTEEHWQYIQRETRIRSEKARLIAEKYNLTFVPLQAGFDKLCELKDATYWLSDGVHPTPMGHEYIKREWIKAFKAINGIG